MRHLVEIIEKARGRSGDVDEALAVYQVSHILPESHIRGPAEAGLRDYVRGLYTIKYDVDAKFLGGLFYNTGSGSMMGRFSHLDLAGHYDGVLFNPKNKAAWNMIAGQDSDVPSHIKPVSKEDPIAIYARCVSHPEQALEAVDVIGGFMGEEKELPFENGRYIGNPESDVEEMACTVCDFTKHFKGGYKLTKDDLYYLFVYIGKQSKKGINKGLVTLRAKVFHDGVEEANVQDKNRLSGLEGMTVSELTLRTRGGYQRCMAHRFLEHFPQ
jgi:hypothetical protein